MEEERGGRRLGKNEEEKAGRSMRLAVKQRAAGLGGLAARPPGTSRLDYKWGKRGLKREEGGLSLGLRGPRAFSREEG